MPLHPYRRRARHRADQHANDAFVQLEAAQHAHTAGAADAAAWALHLACGHALLAICHRLEAVDRALEQFERSTPTPAAEEGGTGPGHGGA